MDKYKKICFKFDCLPNLIQKIFLLLINTERNLVSFGLFFKYIKQDMTIKKFFSRSGKGVVNQLNLPMITSLLTYLIKLKTKSKQSIFKLTGFSLSAISIPRRITQPFNAHLTFKKRFSDGNRIS
jgi:hypothetical protein